MVVVVEMIVRPTVVAVCEVMVIDVAVVDVHEPHMTGHVNLASSPKSVCPSQSLAKIRVPHTAVSFFP